MRFSFLIAFSYEQHWQAGSDHHSLLAWFAVIPALHWTAARLPAEYFTNFANSSQGDPTSLYCPTVENCSVPTRSRRVLRVSAPGAGRGRASEQTEAKLQTADPPPLLFLLVKKWYNKRVCKSIKSNKRRWEFDFQLYVLKETFFTNALMPSKFRVEPKKLHLTRPRAPHTIGILSANAV